MDPVPLSTASTLAALVISASANAPLRPTTETPIVTAVAVALLSPFDWIVAALEPPIVPSTSARVSPVTSAIGIITSMDTPPAEPPGAFALAWFAEVAVTFTAPVVVMFPVEVMVASVERPLLARAIVSPAANTPVLTLTVWALTVCVPLAVTLKPPAPTVPWAPEEALVVPLRFENASAPLMPAPMPASIAMASVGEVIVSKADTLRWSTLPAPPTATLPTLAVASPEVLLTATDAPLVNAPSEAPIALVVGLRIAVVVTSMPPPACSSFAPSSTCAFCVPVSLSTTTCAPTATKPPVPANARPFTFSGFISASTEI